MLLPMKFAIAVGVAAVVGVGRAIHARNEMDRGHACPATRPRAPRRGRAAVRPRRRAETGYRGRDERQPNSWIMARSASARLHVTRGLLAR